MNFSVIASEAKQSMAPQRKLDCFVALLLAMTVPTYGGGGFAIGLRCASAATVDVPIRPCSS
jgi:hypothetical protein